MCTRHKQYRHLRSKVLFERRLKYWRYSVPRSVLLALLKKRERKKRFFFFFLLYFLFTNTGKKIKWKTTHIILYKRVTAHHSPYYCIAKRAISTHTTSAEFFCFLRARRWNAEEISRDVYASFRYTFFSLSSAHFKHDETFRAKRNSRKKKCENK